MPKSATHRTFDPLAIGLGVIAIVTLYRAVLLWFSTADLFMDESQYWLWGQELDWGYYSKPPLIGWVLRGFNEAFGSDAIEIIRLPMVVFHGFTAIILTFAARQVTDPLAAAVCGVVYVTCPFTAAGAFLISTDTILAPFFAFGLLAYLKLTQRSSVGWAVALGISVGLGMMAKYAAIYFLIGAALGMLFVPAARLRLRDVIVALCAFLLVLSPNIIWNLQNDLTTLSHTADNVDWINDPNSKLSLNFDELGSFLGAQFLVFGPVFFGGYLWAIWRAFRKPDWQPRWLVWMSLPILLIVGGQALLNKAFANWAVMTYLAAILLTIPVLWHRARVAFWIGLALNVAITAFVPAAFTQATGWTYGENDRLLMRRFVGRTEMSERIMARARVEALPAILASDRNILADLFYHAKGTELKIFAIPSDGAPSHYYAQEHSFDGQSPEVLVVEVGRRASCAIADGIVEIAEWTPPPGAYERDVIRLYRARGDCWD